MAELPLDVTIRPGSPDDAPAVAAFGQVVTRATYAPIDPAAAEHVAETWWTTESVERSMARTRHWLAVGPDDDLLGVANLGRRDEKAVLWKLYVLPARHGTGLGRRLLEETSATAHADGDETLWLSYVVGNTHAAGFYVSQGFVETHREPDPPYPDQVWMRRDL